MRCVYPPRVFTIRWRAMLQMLRDLIAHKGHADAALLRVIRQHAAATDDPELLDLLHHVLLANRFWVTTVLGLPFVFEDESRRSDSFDALVQRYAQSHAQEARWFENAREADLARTPVTGREAAATPWWHSSASRFHCMAGQASRRRLGSDVDGGDTPVHVR